MSDAGHENRAHAVLGASSAYRWMACPGSIRMIAQAPPQRSSRYADEGTAAHQLAEECLTAGCAAEVAIGGNQLVRGEAWSVTEEMAEAVQVFLDDVRAHQEPGDHLLIEHRFDLSALHPGMFGTNDVCILSPSRRTLFVHDYKHGRGYAVEAVGNPQLRYYGLGALLSVAAGGGIDRIVMTIVQPRAAHRDGPIRRETIDLMEMLEWTMELKAAAERTEDPNAPIVAGDHCRFCPAAGMCPALRDRAAKDAMADFAGLTVKLPESPVALTWAQIKQVLDSADLIDSWVAAVRAHALHLAQSGAATPGYKLVDKRATRKWTDPEQTPQALSALGLRPADFYDEPALLSPAAVEKKLPKDKRAELAALVTKQSSGVNLVPDTDARDAKEPLAIVDFAALF